MPKILIVDPLTLVGREFLHLLPADDALSGPPEFRHTDDDDEHQIADIAGKSVLVPPLEDPSELAEGDAVLVASEKLTRRGEMVAEFLETHDTTPVATIGPCPHLAALTVPATGPAIPTGQYHVRVAHPSLVMLANITECLRDMDPESATVAAADPVSVRGREEIALLAQQAAARLQGAEVKELIDDHVLAFNMVAVEADDLDRDAALVMPEVSVSATRVISGCFHGHAAFVWLTFARSVSEHEVFELLRHDERLADPDIPLALDASTDANLITLSAPSFSGDGRNLSITAMADGLRIGGAYTALEVLRTLL